MRAYCKLILVRSTDIRLCHNHIKAATMDSSHDLLHTGQDGIWLCRVLYLSLGNIAWYLGDERRPLLHQWECEWPGMLFTGVTNPMLKYQVSFCKSYIIEHRVHQFVFKQSRNSFKLIVYYDHAYYYASIAIDEMNRSSVTIQMNS